MKTKNILTIIFSLVLLQMVYTQDSVESCSEDPKHKILDFWVGNWNVYDTNGTLIGENLIEKILSGCAVMENWKDADGGEGKSLFYVDNNTGKWKQVWVTDNANFPLGQKEKEMTEFTEGSLTFMGSINYNSKTLLDRTILTLQQDGSVSQVIQLSRNNAGSWRTVFTGIYKKK